MKTDQQSPQHQTPTKSLSTSSQALATNQQSPRNMPKGGGSSSSTSTSSTYVSFGPLIVSKALQDGEKFVKWDEVSVIFNK